VDGDSGACDVAGLPEVAIVRDGSTSAVARSLVLATATLAVRATRSHTAGKYEQQMASRSVDHSALDVLRCIMIRIYLGARLSLCRDKRVRYIHKRSVGCVARLVAAGRIRKTRFCLPAACQDRPRLHRLHDEVHLLASAILSADVPVIQNLIGVSASRAPCRYPLVIIAFQAIMTCKPL
jgi:hypothetical protein